MNPVIRIQLLSAIICTALITPGDVLAAAPDSRALAAERFAPGITDASQTTVSRHVKALRQDFPTRQNNVVDVNLCGNSEPDPGEECDDGNTVNGDGCDSMCQLGSGSVCTLPIAGQDSEDIIGDGSFENDDGSWTLIGSALNPRCSPQVCGPDLATDGSVYLWLAGVFLENGNTATATQTLVIPASATTLQFEWASGSNATPDDCESPADDRLELFIDGVSVFRSPNPCTGVFPFQTETIDLVAAGVADGGSHTLEFFAANVDAAIDPGSFLTNFFLDKVRLPVPLANPIPPVPSLCLVTVCGDSILSPGETCDDGNASDGDGCSATCTVEIDFVCSDPLLDAAEYLQGINADAIIEGSLEDRRGRPTTAWTENRASPGDLLPICSQVFCPMFSDNMSSDGIFYALFGASTSPSDTSISQTTTIPTTATDLTFDLLVTTPGAGACDSNFDFLEVTIDGNPEFLYDCVTPIDEYTQQVVDISAYADGGDHEITVRGVTVSVNGEPTHFFVDNISIPLPDLAIPEPSVCVELDTACAPVETFDAGIPASWTVINEGPDTADGWGTTGDGICLSENAAALAGLFGTDNLTTGTGGAACADSDATGQVDIDGGGTANEMDTYLCSPPYDLSFITGPSFSFNTYYAAANNQLNDNGTPGDFSDDFDDDLLEVLVGTSPPNVLTIGNYASLGSVHDHEDGDLSLTTSQERTFSLEGTQLEGAAEGYVCMHYSGNYAGLAQIDNAALRGEDCMLLSDPESDGDGVPDDIDNCTVIPNPLQEDTDGDGIGNACDPDINNDCIVNFVDIGQFSPRFNTSFGDAGYDENFDLDSSGTIGFLDYIGFTSRFNTPPGPSANQCVPALRRANDHGYGSLLLTGAQELAYSLEGTELEGASTGYVCVRYRGTSAGFAQIDNAALRGENCSVPPVDSDGDGVFDSTDNCTFVPNPDQIDTNSDGIGNRCDADVNNDCIIAFIDIAQFPSKFNSAIGDPQYDEDFDIDSSGGINFVDYLTFTQSFNGPPGPSANPCVPGLGN